MHTTNAFYGIDDPSFWGCNFKREKAGRVHALLGTSVMVLMSDALTMIIVQTNLI